MAAPRPRIIAYAWRATVVVLAITAWLAWTRQAHAMTPWSQRPERIAYCDRDYQRNPMWVVVAGTEIRNRRAGAGRPLEQVGRIPPFFGRPVLAPESVPIEGWAEPPCPTGLLLDIGDDRYVAYDLVGGP